ncbi:MAG: PAS domain S-box protein [Thermoguttaceae bacterium]|nr:PAS domain S-box protein [Thermoguttaceae bacterium]MDW8036498.1 PAS domain S-box protein [Thermoguttaceae bacterium]
MPISGETAPSDRLRGVESLLAGLEQKAASADPRAKQQAAVLAFGRRTSARPPLNVLLEDAAALIAEVLQLDRIGVGKVVDSGHSIAFRIATLGKQGLLRDTVDYKYTLDPTTSMAAYCLQTAGPVTTASLRKESRFTDLFLQQMEVGGALMLPLIVGGKPFGVLGVFARDKKSFTMEDVQFAETISYLLISSLARIQAEEQLQQQQNLAQTVLEVIDAFVVSVDAEGRILQVNPTFQKYLGFQPAEIEGRLFWDVLALPKERELIRAVLNTVRHEPKPIQFEGSLLDKQGQKHRICWTVKLLSDSTNPRMVLCGLDQTEILRMKEELRQAYQRSHQTSQVVQELCRALQTNAAVISPQILASLQELAKPIQPPPFRPLRLPVPEEQRQFVRRVYRYRQKVAPYTEGRFPRPEEFVQVQCKDISAGGIGFFMEKEPAFHRLVIALGEGAATSYFLAEVVRSSQVEHQGQKMYLIGCKFCGRITPPADFKLPASPQ